MDRSRYVIIPVILLIIALFSSAYIVDETEQVVVTQFGKPVAIHKKAGLYFKLPFIQQEHYFPKNILEWDGDPGQIPTKDKTFIWVDTFARWKIEDPLKFFETVNNEMAAQARLDDIIDSAVRNVISSYPLIETVRLSNRKLDTFEMVLGKELKLQLPYVKVGRQGILALIKKQAEPKLKDFGIKLVDVDIKRVNYIEEVRRAVYARMIAERKRIAEKFRSEGRGEARRIEGEMEKELKRIMSEAYEKSQEIKGKADAEAARIYADAYSKDPEFYSFLKSLETYKKVLNKKSVIVLTTDAELLRYLKGINIKVKESQGR